MQLTSLAIAAYTEHDPDRIEAQTPYDDAIALRLLPGDCTLSLVAEFSCDPDELQERITLPRLFVSHSEEGGAVAYSVVPLVPQTTERGDNDTLITARYELPFHPARAGHHALLLEVADGGHIESHEWMLRVRHAYDA